MGNTPKAQTQAAVRSPQAVIPDPELIHDSSDELSWDPSLDDDGGDIFPPFREEGIQVSSLYNDEDRTYAAGEWPRGCRVPIGRWKTDRDPDDYTGRKMIEPPQWVLRIRDGHQEAMMERDLMRVASELSDTGDAKTVILMLSNESVNITVNENSAIVPTVCAALGCLKAEVFFSGDEITDTNSTFEDYGIEDGARLQVRAQNDTLFSLTKESGDDFRLQMSSSGFLDGVLDMTLVNHTGWVEAGAHEGSFTLHVTKTVTKDLTNKPTTEAAEEFPPGLGRFGAERVTESVETREFAIGGQRRDGSDEGVPGLCLTFPPNCTVDGIPVKVHRYAARAARRNHVYKCNMCATSGDKPR